MKTKYILSNSSAALQSIAFPPLAAAVSAAVASQSMERSPRGERYIKSDVRYPDAEVHTDDRKLDENP